MDTTHQIAMETSQHSATGEGRQGAGVSDSMAIEGKIGKNYFYSLAG